MNFQHGLQHLDVKPQNLFLVGSHVKVADFGLVNRLPEKRASDPATPRSGQGSRDHAALCGTGIPAEPHQPPDRSI